MASAVAGVGKSVLNGVHFNSLITRNGVNFLAGATRNADANNPNSVNS